MVLDNDLEQRLQLLEASGQIDPDVAAFVRDAVRGLAAAADRPPTDALFGTLCTHTAMALQRARRGEALAAWDTDHSAELAQHPRALGAAQELVRRAAETLAVELPATEEQFIALHLAALDAKGA